MLDQERNIIIYRTTDGRAAVALYAHDGKIWVNQQQMAELLATSKPNISMHIANILKENVLTEDSVVKKFLTTAADNYIKRMPHFFLLWIFIFNHFTFIRDNNRCVYIILITR